MKLTAKDLIKNFFLQLTSFMPHGLFPSHHTQCTTHTPIIEPRRRYPLPSILLHSFLLISSESGRRLRPHTHSAEKRSSGQGPPNGLSRRGEPFAEEGERERREGKERGEFWHYKVWLALDDSRTNENILPITGQRQY